MSIFLDNKYTKWYFSIVTNPDKNATYTENHHIIPSAMGGGDEAENKVRLSARQHFVAHLLLTKMTEGINFGKAVSGMRQMRRASKGQERYVPSSKIFEMLRKLTSAQQKERMALLWLDEDYRAKQKEGIRKFNALPGATERRKASTKKGLEKPSTIENRRLAALNRPKHSEETKKKMRKSWAKNNGIAHKYLPPKQKRWKATAPDGSIFEFDDLMNFCINMKLHQAALTITVKTGAPLPSMQRKRRDTSEERKNVIGWQLEKR